MDRLKVSSARQEYNWSSLGHSVIEEIINAKQTKQEKYNKSSCICSNSVEEFFICIDNY